MATLQRPGVFINEVLTGAVAANSPTGDTVAAFVGSALRGPTVPTLVVSWADFVSKFGDFTYSTNLATAVWLFFANGGGQCWVTRVIHSDAVVATRIFQDIVPANTLSISAVNAGAWGNSINIDVVAGFTTGRFNITVYLGGTTAAFVVEQWNDLSNNPTDPRYVQAVVNGNSLYITTATIGTTFTAPSAVAGQPLATGADGTAAADADFTASVNLLASVTSPMVLNLPGESAASRIIAVQGSNPVTNGACFLVVDPPQGQTVAQVLSWAATLTVTSTTAAYYPWIVVNDPSKFTVNTTKTVPPGGAVMGQFMQADTTKGPFQTPAGVNSRLVGAIDLEIALQPSDYDTLNNTVPPVNAIKPVPGYGICIFGGRTLKAGMPDRYISVRRSLIYLETMLKNLTQFAVFAPNDERLWATLSSVTTDFLSGYYQKGGLRGATSSEAFYVVCDSTNNTSASVANGQVNVEIGVALEYPAEFIVIRVGQFDGGTTVTNSLAQ